MLSTPEWKSTPWQVIPKNLKDVLVGVLIDIPGLLEDLDNMRSCDNASRQAALRLRLIQKCWEHDRRLLQWCGLVCRGENPSKHAFPESRGRDIVTYVAIIHGMSLFWITCLILYSTLQMASEPQACLPERTDPNHYARKLTEVISILLQPSAGLYGLQSMSLPLEIVLQYAMTTSSLSKENETLLMTVGALKDDLGSGMARVVDANTRLVAEWMACGTMAPIF